MGDMKNAIKEISINLFYKKGYFATSISDIAREAGIQKSSIYYHYSNKEEILFDILKTTMVDLDENLEKQIKEGESLLEEFEEPTKQPGQITVGIGWYQWGDHEPAEEEVE